MDCPKCSGQIVLTIEALLTREVLREEGRHIFVRQAPLIREAGDTLEIACDACGYELEGEVIIQED